MLSLNKLAELSTNRLYKRIEVAMKQTSDKNKLYTTENKPFDERLINSCKKQRDNPDAINETIFIAHPERLFDRLSYMVIGEGRDLKKLSPDYIGLSKQQIENLDYFKTLGNLTEFSNLDKKSNVEGIESVLICHGLSPIGDSLLLLADIGRAYRTSKVIGKPLRVMLADPTWMSSNRSIYRFETLSDDEIDTGLRIAFHKREKLYSELKIAVDKKGISPYDRENAISAKKLNKICTFYAGLTTAIWGNVLKNNDLQADSSGKNNAEIIKVLTKPLENLPSLEGIAGFEVPSHMKAFSQFPGVLRSLENSLKHHLEILRTIAQLFSTFDSEIFSYFFTQYYAQKPYRGRCVKIAPVSESKFDKPFDDLDLYFKSWGEGHTTSDLLAEGYSQLSSEEKLSAIYLPQYQLGDLKLLPYTPFSLDALKIKPRNHKLIAENTIILDESISLEKIESILLKTPLIERNRVVSDILSFLCLTIKSVGFQCIDDAREQLYLEEFYSILSDIHPSLKDSFKNEIEDFYEHSHIHEVWKTWLSKIQEEKNPTYIPSHIILFLLEEDDWSNDYIRKNIVKLVALAVKIYQILVR